MQRRIGLRWWHILLLAIGLLLIISGTFLASRPSLFEDDVAPFFGRVVHSVNLTLFDRPSMPADEVCVYVCSHLKLPTDSVRASLPFYFRERYIYPDFIIDWEYAHRLGEGKAEWYANYLGNGEWDVTILGYSILLYESSGYPNMYRARVVVSFYEKTKAIEIQRIEY